MGRCLFLLLVLTVAEATVIELASDHQAPELPSQFYLGVFAQLNAVLPWAEGPPVNMDVW